MFHPDTGRSQMRVRSALSTLEDDSTMRVKLVYPGASVAVRDKNNEVVIGSLRKRIGRKRLSPTGERSGCPKMKVALLRSLIQGWGVVCEICFRNFHQRRDLIEQIGVVGSQDWVGIDVLKPGSSALS